MADPGEAKGMRVIALGLRGVSCSCFANSIDSPPASIWATSVSRSSAASVVASSFSFCSRAISASRSLMEASKEGRTRSQQVSS